MMQRITILGSTGSIGLNTLAVIRRFPQKFSVAGLSTNANIGILYRQIKEFHPSCVCVKNIAAGLKLKSWLKTKRTLVLLGEEGLQELVKDKQSEAVVLAIGGAAALTPLLKAIENRKKIALANKESLVMAGSLIMRKAKDYQAKIIPIDSEQSAIWQCLNGQDKNKLKQIYLTASGGPLRQVDKRDFSRISVNQVLSHPRWKMGKKISVDSATLMNKGLEILETMFLFGIPLEKIKILIHPEAIIHSMVEFIDGVVLAQLSITDMRIPIQYALSYPQRLTNTSASIDFFKLKSLNFQRPDFKRFACLGLAQRAARELGTMPAVLNAANEVCVEAFLNRRLKFSSIPRTIEKIMERHRKINSPGLKDILAADAWTREETQALIGKAN